MTKLDDALSEAAAIHDLARAVGLLPGEVAEAGRAPIRNPTAMWRLALWMASTAVPVTAFYIIGTMPPDDFAEVFGGGGGGFEELLA
jgi:hypothetical protein